MRFIFHILVVFVFTNTLYAHQTGLSYLDLRLNEKNKVEVIYKKPLSDTRGEDIEINYPSRCVQESHVKKEIMNGFIVRNFELNCGEEALQDSYIWVTGLVSSDRGVMVRYEEEGKVYQSLLRSITPFFQVNKEISKTELSFKYIELGILHILEGFDHLSFVLGLLVLANSLRKLLYIVTAFTISHSLTLVYGVIGTATINISYVEAMIALSILLLAKEIVLERITLTKRYLGIVVFLFGLVHGFGFSSSLSSIGLPHDEIPLTLFSFNVGVEIGQIIFIFIATVLLSIVYKFVEKKKVDRLIAYIIGSVSSFWLFQRVML